MHSILKGCSHTQPRCSSSLWRTLNRFSTTKYLHNELITPKVDYEAKYAEKLQKRAAERGASVAELRQRLKEEAAKQREKLASAAQASTTLYPTLRSEQPKLNSSASTSASIPARRDSSPIKPLSTIINVEKLLETPHTPEQVSLLWRAYHASRSKGTGRGYLCATIPVDAYERMVSVASKYPCFVLPVQREGAQVSGAQIHEDQKAYEFYFMEWGFHGAPLDPQPGIADPFAKPKPSANPQTSTILFTPLQEYKQRAAFATPYLVLTNYSEFARSHGIVLLHGEITPSSSNTGDAGGDGRYMLSQQDAQLLAMGTQRFYLWDGGKGERKELLKTFHDNPSGFKWEELLKHTDLPA